MEIPQLDTTNLFLGIVAGLAVLQMLVFIAGAIWLRRTVGRVSQMAAEFESHRLGPVFDDVRRVANQAQHVVTEVQSAVHRVNTFVGGIEHGTRRVTATVDAVNERVDAVVNRVDAVVNTGWNEVHALKSGVRRGVTAFVRSVGRR